MKLKWKWKLYFTLNFDKKVVLSEEFKWLERNLDNINYTTDLYKES